MAAQRGAHARKTSRRLNRFHNYSFGNALLAVTQCRHRNLEPGLLDTYSGWLELKRQLRKWEKGIT
jgi:hypothetical protein